MVSLRTVAMMARFISTLPATFRQSQPPRRRSLSAPNGPKMSCAAYQRAHSLSVVSRDLLDPLPPPSRRLEGIREILCLVHDLAVAEFHNAHCVCWSSLVSDCVFRDPDVHIRSVE